MNKLSPTEVTSRSPRLRLEFSAHRVCSHTIVPERVCLENKKYRRKKKKTYHLIPGRASKNSPAHTLLITLRSSVTAETSDHLYSHPSCRSVWATPAVAMEETLELYLELNLHTLWASETVGSLWPGFQQPDWKYIIICFVQTCHWGKNSLCSSSNFKKETKNTTQQKGQG